MSQIKNNEITHTSNSGTSNIILGSNGEVTTQGVLTPTGGLSANSIDSDQYVDGSIDHVHLADDCVDGDNIADNSVTLAHMAGGTDGQIITYDANGDPVAVGPGTDGQVLTSTGAGSPPAFETLSAGKVLQYVLTHYGTNVSINTTSSYTSTGVTAQITPQKSSSKIVGILALQARGHSVTTTDWGYIIKVQRESTDIYDDGDSSDFTGCVYMYSASSSLHFANKSSFIFADTGHSTTSAITYTVYAKVNNAAEDVKFQDGSHRSQLLLLEVE